MAHGSKEEKQWHIARTIVADYLDEEEGVDQLLDPEVLLTEGLFEEEGEFFSSHLTVMRFLKHQSFIVNNPNDN